MKFICKLFFLTILIIVCLSTIGCGRAVNTHPTALKSSESTSGNTSGASILSTTNSKATQSDTSIPTMQNAGSTSTDFTPTSESSTTGEKQTATSGVKSISSEDFNVSYKELILNDRTSLEDLTKKLGFIPGEEDNETMVTRAAGWNNDMDYYWYRLSYPNKEKEEISIDYLYNSTKKTGRIVSIDLKNIPTMRDITVGDTLKKIKLAYGNKYKTDYDSDTTEYIDFALNNNTLAFVYKKTTGKIISIWVDYDSNKAMEEMDITGFVD